MPDDSVACGIIIAKLENLEKEIAAIKQDMLAVKLEKANFDGQAKVAKWIGSSMVAGMTALAIWTTEHLLWPVIKKTFNLE